MAISRAVERLIEARDAVDEMFLTYSRPEVVRGNIKSLSQMALIGGRLDAIIRRQYVRDREARRRDMRALTEVPEIGPGT